MKDDEEIKETEKNINPMGLGFTNDDVIHDDNDSDYSSADEYDNQVSIF